MKGWRKEIGRWVVMISISMFLGLVTNSLSNSPVSLLATTGPGAWPEKASRVTTDDFRFELSSGRLLLILDVRSDQAFRAGHPARAIHAPATEFVTAYHALGLSRILRAADGVVVLCDSEDCPSGDRVARMLADFGHQDVRVLYGGWKAYEQSGLGREGS